MDLFTRLFGDLLVFVYHCFDRIVINGYLSNLSRPEQVVYFFRQVLGIPVVSKEVLSKRTEDYKAWVEAYARNHGIPVEWAGKGVRKEDYVLPALRRMERKNAFGVYFIFRSMEQGRTFRISVPKYPTQDPNHPGAPDEPLHPFLLLRPGRGAGADCHTRGVVLSVPRHVLSQRPLVHGTRTDAR
jgi:hypothetical protein